MAENRTKILMVDDEEEILLYLAKILERANYEVISTSKGKEAQGLAKKHNPDLIILDMLLPDMSGAEIKRALLNDNDTKNIPTLFLTGILTKEDEKLLKDLTGQVRSIAKPVTPKDFLATISRVLEESA